MIDSALLSDNLMFLFNIALPFLIVMNNNAGVRAWGICSCKDSTLEWEATSTNAEARFALLAYMGAEV